MIVENNENFEVLLNEEEVSNKEKWLETRKLGIGGSDAGTVMGMNKFSTRLKLYLERTGELEQFTGNKSTKRGSRLEPVIRKHTAEDFLEQFEVEIKVKEFKAMMRSKKHSFMLANIDGLVEHPEKGEGILEIKTATFRSKEDWEDGGIPPQYFCQIQHYMAVTGLSWALIVCWIDDDVEFRVVDRDEEFINGMIEVERVYWEEHIGKLIPPAVAVGDKAVLSELYNVSVENTIELNAFDDAITSMQDVKENIKELNSAKELVENRIKEAMQDNKRATTSNWKMSWSRSETTKFDSKKFKAENPDLYKKYEYATTRDSGLRITKKK